MYTRYFSLAAAYLIPLQRIQRRLPTAILDEESVGKLRCITEDGLNDTTRSDGLTVNRTGPMIVYNIAGVRRLT